MAATSRLPETQSIPYGTTAIPGFVVPDADERVGHNFRASTIRVPRQEAGNKTTFFVGETPYASVELDGETLRFRVRKPSDVTGLEPMLRFYQESVEGGATWLLFSMHANNKPAPAIEAGLGRFAGTALRQLRMAQGG